MRFVTQRWWTSMHVCKHLITQVGEVHVCNPHHPAWVPVQLAGNVVRQQRSPGEGLTQRLDIVLQQLNDRTQPELRVVWVSKPSY